MLCQYIFVLLFFFFNDTATTEIYTLSLHDALPILLQPSGQQKDPESGSLLLFFPIWVHGRVRPAVHPPIAGGNTARSCKKALLPGAVVPLWKAKGRSEEHTSELQSLVNLVCRLLLEKKKTKKN